MVAAPGAKVPAVRGVSFRLEPGHAVGVAGPSASGKSTLAKALAGVWPPMGGKATLGGAALDQYGEEALARHLGWLPQEVVLFEGTVAENIARLAPEPDPETVVEAAVRAGAHEMILALPGGYDFQVTAGGAALSGGQRQRIALARAFYGDPAVVVLDEPDAHLDTAGAEALNRAIAELKARGGAAVIVAHRPGTFAECDVVLLMENGQTRPAGGLLPGTGGHRRPQRAPGAAPGGSSAGAVVPVRLAKPPTVVDEGGQEGAVRLIKVEQPPGRGGEKRGGNGKSSNGGADEGDGS